VIIGSGITPTHEQRAEHAIPAHEGHGTGASQLSPEQQGIAIDAERPGIIGGAGPKPGCEEYMTGQGALQRLDSGVVDDLVASRDVDGTELEMVGLRVGEGDERSIRARNLASAHRSGVQDITQRSIRESTPGYFEQQVYALLLAAQRVMAEHLFLRSSASHHAA
jgi:hypothetical protein